MRIVCISCDRDGADATAMIAGLAVALRSENQHVLVLDPDPRTPLVQKSAPPSLGQSLMRAFTDAHLPYDHVLFHCLASFRGLAMTALAAADLALLPVSADPSSPEALEGTLRTVAMVERSRGQALPALIVPFAGSAGRFNVAHPGGPCTMWDEPVPSTATPIAAHGALQRLAAWLLNDGAAAVRATQPSGLAAA
jgi:hypothetical protein